MEIYSTESDEHKINTGQIADPELEDGMEFTQEERDAWNSILNECHGHVDDQ